MLSHLSEVAENVTTLVTEDVTDVILDAPAEGVDLVKVGICVGVVAGMALLGWSGYKLYQSYKAKEEVVEEEKTV